MRCVSHGWRGHPGASGVRVRLALEALHGPHWVLRASGDLPGTWDLTHSFVAGFSLGFVCFSLVYSSIHISLVSSARPVLGPEVWLSSQEGTVPVLLRVLCRVLHGDVFFLFVFVITLTLWTQPDH